MEQVGKTLVMVGSATAGVGLLLWAIGAASGGRAGRLPGDIVWERGGFTLYAPFMTMLVVSAVMTLALWIIGYLRR